MNYTVQEDLEEKLSVLQLLNMALPLARATELKLAHVLVTGATGLLGIYIVQELLLHTDAIIYCLVRSETPEQGLARIVENLALYRLSGETLAARRIIPVMGNLQVDQLGMEPDAYDQLARTVDTIVHCAANTSFVASYEVSRRTNVCGTYELLRFAAAVQLKDFHYISSCSVRIPAYYQAADADIGLFNGYSKSKYVSEQLVKCMFDRGLPGVQYTIGYLYTPEDLGASSSFESFIRLCMELKLVPKMDTYFDYTPIEYASGAIADIAVQREFQHRDRSLHHPVALCWDDIVAAVQLVEPEVEALPFTTFFPIFQTFMKRYRGMRIYAMKRIISKNFPLQLNAMFKEVASDFPSNYCPPTYSVSDLASIFKHMKETFVWS